MKILLTGASGFLGNIIHNQLKVEHDLICIGRNEKSDIVWDLNIHKPVLPKADLVVHAAGKAHAIPVNREQEQEFFDINVYGTQNLLEALAQSTLPKGLVFISSVAVYGLESGNDIDESFPLLAQDAYGKSKLMAEKLILEWGKAHHVNVVILRLPLICGPNPPGNLGSMIKAIQSGYYFRIGIGNARRSVVDAQDIAKLIPILIEYHGIFNLTSGFNPSISEIENQIALKFNKRIRKIPFSLAKIIALAGDYFGFLPLNSRRLMKVTTTLTFSDSLARNEIGWNANHRTGLSL